MPAIIKKRLRIQNAKDFLSNLDGHPRTSAVASSIALAGATEAERLADLKSRIGSHVIDRNLYMFIGRPRPWPTDLSAGTNELSPPLPLDTVEKEFRAWDGMLGLKKITSSFASLVVPRFNWDASGSTIYKAFDDKDADLFNHPTTAEIAAGNLGGYTAGSVYVMTDEYHIFKCLSNNLSAKSTIKPLKPLSAPFTFQGADGYLWKYLSTVTPGQVVKFLTDRWIPVNTLESDDGSTQWVVQQAATDGSIDSFAVDNRGSGYTNVHSGTLQSATSTSGVLAATLGSPTLSASDSDSVYDGAQIHIISGAGAGQIREISNYVGETKRFDVDSSWSANTTSVYEVTPKLVISGNGTGAVAKAVVEYAAGANQFKIKSIVLINAGTGYRFASVAITGAGGTGGSVRAVLGAPGGHGSDIVQELGAGFVMLNVRLQYEEGAGDFPASNDYRQIGVIRDLQNNDTTLATSATRIATKVLSLTGVTAGGVGDFTPDEDVLGTLGSIIAIGQAVGFTSTGIGTGTVSFIQDEITGYTNFLENMTLVGLTSGATASVSSVISEEIKKFEGEILYIENRRPVLRAPDQVEDIKCVIEW